MEGAEGEYQVRLSAEIRSRFLNVASTVWIIIFSLYTAIELILKQPGSSGSILSTFLSSRVWFFSACTFLPILAILYYEKRSSTGYLGALNIFNPRVLYQIGCLSLSQYIIFYAINFSYPDRPLFSKAKREAQMMELNLAVLVILLYTIVLCSTFVVVNNGFKVFDETLIPYYKIFKTKLSLAIRLLAFSTIFYFFLGDTLSSLAVFFFTKIFKFRFKIQENFMAILGDYKLMASIYISGLIVLVLLSIVSHLLRAALLDVSKGTGVSSEHRPICYTDLLVKTANGGIPTEIKSLKQGLLLPSNTLGRHLAFRRLSHLAEYSPKFILDLYNSSANNDSVWQDIYEIMIREICGLNEKILEKLKLLRPAGVSDPKILGDKDEVKTPNVYVSLFLYLAQWSKDVKKEKDIVKPAKPASKTSIYNWLLSFNASRWLLAEKSQRDDALMFQNYQTTIWAAKCLSALIVHASDDCYEIVNDTLPIVLPVCVDTLSSIDGWLKYNLQYKITPFMRTAYADSAIHKAETLKDVLETCIYNMVSMHFESLQRCDFSSKCCDKLQLFVDFKY